MKTLLALIIITTLGSVSAFGQTAKLEQRSASNAWVTVQTQTGKSGSFSNVANGTYRVSITDQGVTNIVDKDSLGKSLTVPQTSPKQTSSTFQIAGQPWKLMLVFQGPTVGWNWGKSVASSANNAR